MPFHNTYHFVPVKADHKGDLSTESFRAGEVSQVTHDRYVKATKSGRIVCRLTAESPFVLGAQHHIGEPTVVEPFEFKKGIPVIPGSSLRGLISGIAEAASNSALRVLEDRIYSYRRRADKDSLSAIGMVIVSRGENGSVVYQLRPLTWPTLPAAEDRGAKSNQPPAYKLPADFTGMFQTANLRVHIGTKTSIRDPRFPYKTWSPKHPVFYGMRLHPRKWAPGTSLASDEYLHQKNGFLLGQKPLAATPGDVLPRKWQEIPQNERGEYTRGIMRVLGCQGREAMPNTKYHELFIPYPEGAEAWPPLTLPDNVVTRFHELADERTESLHNKDHVDEMALLPFHPAGTARNNSADDGRKFRLKDGDLVYFRARNGEVADISLSSIWRGRVEARDGTRQSLHNFFGHIDPELLPFSPHRRVITAAERLFGFVELRDKKDKGNQQALALSGRVRFSDGHLERYRGAPLAEGQKYYEDSVTLRILGSPKPPCPAMYFKTARDKNSYIKKSDLDATKHQPQGRKFYLHNHAPLRNGKPLWATLEEHESLNQKARVSPVTSSTEFWFHVDFYNLNDTELALLRYSLRPLTTFRHKLGMGKSIGLGQVRIDPAGIFFVDRPARYSAEGLADKRYTSAWLASGEATANLPDRYGFEKQADVNVQSLEEYKPDADIAKALELLGKSRTPKDVHTPTLNSDVYSEEEAFEWFVANDKSKKQESLQPIHAGTTSLPTLAEDPLGDEPDLGRARR